MFFKSQRPFGRAYFRLIRNNALFPLKDIEPMVVLMLQKLVEKEI